MRIACWRATAAGGSRRRPAQLPQKRSSAAAPASGRRGCRVRADAAAPAGCSNATCGAARTVRNGSTAPRLITSATALSSTSAISSTNCRRLPAPRWPHNRPSNAARPGVGPAATGRDAGSRPGSSLPPIRGRGSAAPCRAQRRKATPRVSPIARPVATMSLRFGLSRDLRDDRGIDDREGVVHARVGEHQRLGFVLDEPVHHALHFDHLGRLDLLSEVFDVSLRSAIACVRSVRWRDARGRSPKPPRRPGRSTRSRLSSCCPYRRWSWRRPSRGTSRRPPERRLLAARRKQYLDEVVAPDEFFDEAAGLAARPARPVPRDRAAEVDSSKASEPAQPPAERRSRHHPDWIRATGATTASAR